VPRVTANWAPEKPPHPTADPAGWCCISPRIAHPGECIAKPSRTHAQLSLSPKRIESHIACFFTKLTLLPESDDHRCVLAALVWLQDEPTAE
jgi:hypothetical protein